jgi:hypothetical protein
MQAALQLRGQEAKGGERGIAAVARYVPPKITTAIHPKGSPWIQSLMIEGSAWGAEEREIHTTVLPNRRMCY